MPEELYTHTGTDVATQVKRLFGDADGRQIDNADILLWINIAQQEISSQNAVLHDEATTNLVAGQANYTYPSAVVQYIESLHLNGRPLRPLSFLEAQSYILDRNPGNVAEDPATGNPEIWYERNSVIYLWPVPDFAGTNILRLFYVKRPADLTLISDDLTIPDRYFQRLVDNVLARAYQLDENWEAANYKQQEFFNGMNMLANQERLVQANIYPSPFVRPEDL